MTIITQLIDTSIDLIIFDCDGVLIDSETLSKRVLLLELSALNVNVSSEYFDTHFLGRSFEHVTHKILKDYDFQLPSGFRENYHTALMQTFEAELHSTSALEETLSRLNVPFCVATSSSPQRVAHALTVTGLSSFFSGNIFTCSEVEHGKPAPDIFLHAARVMNVAPKKCLVIEDSVAGINAGKNANMHVVQYAGASHLENVDASLLKMQHQVNVIKHWEQLFELVPSLCN